MIMHLPLLFTSENSNSSLPLKLLTGLPAHSVPVAGGSCLQHLITEAEGWQQASSTARISARKGLCSFVQLMVFQAPNCPTSEISKYFSVLIRKTKATTISGSQLRHMFRMRKAACLGRLPQGNEEASQSLCHPGGSLYLSTGPDSPPHFLFPSHSFHGT